MSSFTESANLHNICKMRNCKRKRLSSFDKTGGNDDRIHIKKGVTATIMNENGAGVITHIWMTLGDGGNNMFRRVLIRMYWDNEKSPSVECPIGDFFGMGHAMSKNFNSAPLQMSPENGKGFNSWWPMPYSANSRIEIVNECEKDMVLYYYVDYEKWDKIEDGLLRFHAKWARECPTEGVDPANLKDHTEWSFGGENKDGKDNYVVLEAEGKGHYCGCNINIHNLNNSNLGDWPGEGDDMIFIDGEEFPSLYGTGTEDYVNMAWCPSQEYNAPYHGLIMGGKNNWKGKITYYRYHITDPVMFEKKIKVTIEHGHNNHRSDDWSTTAYWYQTEPHKPFEQIAEVEKRLPVEEHLVMWERNLIDKLKNK